MTLQAHGAATAPSRFAPLGTDRMITGLWTQRSPLRDGATPFLYAKFYHGTRYDSLLDGRNVEITSRLTLARRPGLTAYNAYEFPRITRFYEFRQFSGASETIRVMADCAAEVYDATGPNSKILVFTKTPGAGSTFFQSVGNVLFMGNGVDAIKYLNSPAGWVTQKWGIGLSTDTATSGPNTAGAGASVGGVVPWTNPSHATDATGFATTSLMGTPNTVSVPGTAMPWDPAVNPAYAWSSPYVNGTAAVVAIDSLLAGQMVTVTASGTVHYSIGDPGFGPNGQTSMLSAGGPLANGQAQPRASLIGAFTDGAGVIIQTVVIRTGAAFIVPPGATQLLVGVVDDNWSDNSGAFSVTAQATLSSTAQLQATDFGFALSADFQPTGVSISFTGYADQAALVNVYLLKNGNPTGSYRQVLLPAGAPGVLTVGSEGDLWNEVFSADDINSAAFGVVLVGVTGGRSYYAQAVQATVYNNNGPTVALTGAGSFAAVNGGYQWAFAYGNSLTKHCSTASNRTARTGNFSAQAYAAVTVKASSDPQVNQIRLFRTVDNGATLLEHPNSPFPNADATIHDSAVDAALNPFSPAPIDHANDPPLAGITGLAYHRGRVWGIVGNQVIYSGGPDTQVGSGYEAFPPANVFTFPSRVVRLWPCALGILVFSVSDNYIILGLGTANSRFYSDLFLEGIGLLNYDAFCVNGSTAHLMTTDAQVMSLDPGAGVVEEGHPIGDQFENAFNPATAYCTWYSRGSGDKGLYVGDGATGWFRMTSALAPETGIAWSPKAEIANGCGAVQALEVAPGVKRLLVGPGDLGGQILQRDPAVNTDNGAKYPAWADIGSIVLAQPGQLAELIFITADCVKAGSRPTLGTRLGEIAGDFEPLYYSWQDPPQLPAAETLFNGRYYLSQNQKPTFCRHLQMRVEWPSEDAHNELLGYTFFGAIHQERHQ